MKKIKLFIASFIGAIALVFACVFGGVKAETVSATWKADDETVDTSYSVSTNSGLVHTETGFFKISTKVSNSTIASNKSSATADDDNNKTFSTALLCSSTTDGSEKGYYELETLVDAVTIKIYYTMTNKDFGSKNQSKTGNFIYQIDSNAAVTSSNTDNKANTTAYTDSFEVASSGSKVKLYSSGNRLAIFAISASYEAASEGQTSIKFYDNSSLLDTIVYDNGDSITYAPVKTNYTFNGWYTNSDLAEEHKLSNNYTVDGTITTLYAKFTENAKYTVTYYIDGVLDKTEENVYVGTSIAYSPSYDNYGFDGWYLDSNCTDAVDSNYTVSGDVDLYGKKVQLSYNLDQTHMNVYSGGSTTHYNNTIFNFIDTGATPSVTIDESTMTLPDNTTSTYRINKANQSSDTDKLITFKAPYNGFVKIWAAAGNADKNFYICDTTYSTTSYIARKEKPAKNELFEITASIESGKTYVIGSDSRFYIYGIFIERIAVEMHTQYNNNNPALADKLRLIGYIDGITDVAEITSITINATVTRSSDSKVATLSYSINKLFQSFNDDCTATNGRYYAVVIINDIDDLIADTTNDYTLSTLSITVTFDDTSSVTSNGFTSFKIGE